MFLKPKDEVPSNRQCIDPSQALLLAHSILSFLKGRRDVRIFKQKS